MNLKTYQLVSFQQPLWILFQMLNVSAMEMRNNPSEIDSVDDSVWIKYPMHIETN